MKEENSYTGKYLKIHLDRIKKPKNKCYKYYNNVKKNNIY